MAPARTTPHSLDEAQRTTPHVSAVVTTHDLLDSLASLVGIVEGDGGDIVVQDVGLDDAVKKLATDETEFTVDRGSCTTNIVPRFASVVRERRISVLQECNGN